MNEQILLTISILISNRPDTVEKCLRSLDSLRKNVSCELILTDTGCGEKVRAIIEKYADVILEFEWCRDFAKARNMGLDAARGQWFLYLDDDEWFEDTKEIEEFFVSGLYQKYGAVLYLQRNYGNEKGTVYSDTPVSRMVRLAEGVRLQYSIHETFQNTKGPVKLLHSYVHHYGYIYKNKFDKYKHSQRNLIPLLEEHEKDPHNLRHNAQLAQEYNGIGEHLKSIEISLKGIEDYQGVKKKIGNLNSLFVNVVERNVIMYRYEDAITHAEKYIADDRISRLGMARICMLVTKASYEIEQYEKSEKYCDLYLKIYTDYCQNEDWYIGQMGLFLNQSFEERRRCETLCLGISALLKMRKYSKAKQLFDMINLDDRVLVLDVELLKSLIDSYLTSEITTGHPCVYMLNRLLEREQLHGKIVELFEKARKEKPDNVNIGSQKWEYLHGELWYISYLTLSVKKSDAEDVKKKFKVLWNTPEKTLPYSVKLGLWELAEEMGVSMDKVIEEVPYFKWKNAVIVSNKILTFEEIQVLDEKIDQVCGSNTKHRICWELYRLKSQLENLEEEMYDEQEVIDKLVRFSELTVLLAKEIYRTEIMEMHMEMLPGDIQAAVYLTRMKACLDEGKYVLAINLLRDVKNVMPSFAIPVKVYTKTIEKQIKQQEAEAQSAKVEMQQLEKAIRAKIQELMKNKEYTMALQLISQLESIVGQDPELDAWKQLCGDE